MDDDNRDPWRDDRPDDLGPDDDQDDSFAMSVFDAVKGEWVDV